MSCSMRLHSVALTYLGSLKDKSSSSKNVWSQDDLLLMDSMEFSRLSLKLRPRNPPLKRIRHFNPKMTEMGRYREMKEEFLSKEAAVRVLIVAVVGAVLGARVITGSVTEGMESLRSDVEEREGILRATLEVLQVARAVAVVLAQVIVVPAAVEAIAAARVTRENIRSVRNIVSGIRNMGTPTVIGLTRSHILTLEPLSGRMPRTAERIAIPSKRF